MIRATEAAVVAKSADPNYLYSYIRQYESDGDGDFDDGLAAINQPVLLNNRIGHLAENGLQSDAFVYDRRGNLIWDGHYVYAYDAFSRLMGVYERGSALFDAATGQITDRSARGPSKAQFRYDGLGRLITYHNGAETEHYYYYDGVRRIQTTVLPDQDLQRIETRSEYVYGPDYVDEFVLQTWKWTDPQTGQAHFVDTYILQDANYNVVALTDETGLLTDQYVWEPYGTLLQVDTLPIPPPQPALTKTLGHQGLFFYRFDSPTAAPLAPDAVGLYYNRNRWYSPRLGRFTTPDPNETAQLVIGAMAMNGDAWSLLVDAFNAQGHFGEGMNLYGYAGSNPLRNGDPLGLIYDPFEAVDEVFVALTAGRAATAHHALAMFGSMAQKTAIMAIQSGIAAICPPYALYLSVTGMASALEDMMFNGVTYNNSAMLLMSGSGIRRSFGSSVTSLQGMGAAFRGAYNRIGRQYAKMGMVGSGFGAGIGPTKVTNVQARSFRPRSEWHHGKKVWFDDNGFPDFSPYAKRTVPITPTRTPNGDYTAANRAAGYSKTPDGFTWHHHQDYGIMQLVPTDLHRSVGHDGGWSTWGGGR